MMKRPSAMLRRWSTQLPRLRLRADERLMPRSAPMSTNHQVVAPAPLRAAARARGALRLRRPRARSEAAPWRPPTPQRAHAMVLDDLAASHRTQAEPAEENPLLLLPPDEEAYFVLQRGGARSRLRYGELLRAQAAHCRLDLALGTLGSLRRDHGAPDAGALVAVMQACVPARRPDVARELLAELESQPASSEFARRAAHTTLMRVLGEDGDAEGARAVMRRAEAAGLAVDAPMSTVMMKALATSGDRHGAWRHFQLARREGVAVDAVTYSTLIRVCADAGHAERAFGLLDEMHSFGVAPTHQCYDALIAACEQRKDFYTDAFSVFQRMQADGFAPSAQTHLALLRCAARRGDVEMSERIFGLMDAEHMTSSSTRPYVSMFACLGRAIGLSRDEARKNEHVANAESLWRTMAEHCLAVPDVYVLNAYLTVLAKANRLNRAEGCFRGFAEFGAVPNQVSVNIMIQMYVSTRRTRKALAMVAVGRRLGLVPDAVSMMDLVRGCAKAGLRGNGPEGARSERARKQRELWLGRAASLIRQLHAEGHVDAPVRVKSRLSMGTVGTRPLDEKPGTGRVGGSKKAWRDLTSIAGLSQVLHDALVPKSASIAS